MLIQESAVGDFLEMYSEKVELEDKLNMKFITNINKGKKKVGDMKTAEIFYLKNIEDLKEYEEKKRILGKSSNVIRQELWI